MKDTDQIHTKILKNKVLRYPYLKSSYFSITFGFFE